MKTDTPPWGTKRIRDQKAMKKILTMIVLVTAGTAVQADITLDWTFTTTSGVIDGSGTLTVDPSLTSVDGYSGYQVTSFSGTYVGQTITGLGPLSGVGLGGADDLISNLTGNPDNSDANDQLDYDGITIAYDSGSGTAYEKFRQVPYRINQSIPYPDLEVANGNNGTFSTAAEPTPEPGSVALAGMGILSWLVLRRKQRN